MSCRLGAGVLISALYFRIDVYFIERWQGLEAVGGYNAVFRLVEAMRLLPAAVMAVTFPMLVQTTDTRLVQRLGGALAIAGVVLALVCALGASLIVPLIYGRPYLYAAPAFSILALALPLFFLNYALTHQVIGWDGQRAYLLIAALALVANIAANLALVPSQGMVGAAIATLLTEIVVTIGCVYALWNHRPERPSRTSVMKLRVEARRHDPDARSGARRAALGSLRVAVRLPADARAARTRAWSASARARTRSRRGGERAICCSPPSSIATACTSRPGDADLIETRARREALSRELLDRDRRILAARLAHAVRPHGRVIGQPRASQRRRDPRISICS